jgi:hypothetical protein
MGIGQHDDFIAGFRMDHDRDLVAHRSRDRQQGRLFSENPRRELFEPDDRGIVPQDVVSDDGVFHRLPHFSGRFCYRIASQVKDRFHRAPPEMWTTGALRLRTLPRVLYHIPNENSLLRCRPVLFA